MRLSTIVVLNHNTVVSSGYLRFLWSVIKLKSLPVHCVLSEGYTFFSALIPMSVQMTGPQKTTVCPCTSVSVPISDTCVTVVSWLCLFPFHQDIQKTLMTIKRAMLDM